MTKHTVYVDDRSIEQQTSHPIVIWGRDRFMSGWGGAQGGYSWAGWAVPNDPAIIRRVEAWVRARGDMQYVRVGGGRPRGRAVRHVHVYVPDPAYHPAWGDAIPDSQARQASGA